MSDHERLARNDEQDGPADEAERIRARDEGAEDVEGHRFFNPAEARVQDSEDEAKRTF